MHGVVWIEHICRIRSARAVAAQLCMCAACFNLHLLAAAVVSCMYTLKFDLKSYINVKWIGLMRGLMSIGIWLAARGEGPSSTCRPRPGGGSRPWSQGNLAGAQAPTAARLCTGCCVYRTRPWVVGHRAASGIPLKIEV